MADKIKPKDFENLYGSLFDNTIDGLAYCQMIFAAQEQPVDFIYVRVNKNFEELTGLKNAEGKKVTELIPGINISNPELFEIYGRVALGGKPERFETYVKPLDRWFLVSVYSPQKNFFTAVFQNITSQKQTEKELANAVIAAKNVMNDLQAEKTKLAEANTKEEALVKELEKFKLAVDNTTDNVIITDPEGIVIYANRSVEKITGYRPEEAIGKKSGALWKNPMPVEYYQKMWDTIKKQKKTFTSEIQNKRKSGEVYTALISIYPILDKNGEIEFFVSVERDITKEKEVEKAKTEFVSLASHQLRTPLSTINWYLEMLMSDDKAKLNDDQTEYAKEAYLASKRMVGLVNALLNVSRIEMGTFIIEPKLINIAEIIKAVISEFEHKSKEKKLEVKVAYELSVPKVMADPKLLDIVCQNLLENAINYTPSGGKIKVSLKSKGNDILIIVEDTGIGIPKIQQPMIFTKLFRADNAREQKTFGNGLGLYMTKSIVEHSGGKIWFSSKGGSASGGESGTTFYVTIPASGMKAKTGTKSLT